VARGDNYPDHKASLTQPDEYVLNKGNFGLQTDAWNAGFPLLNRKNGKAF
jgi:hypothetical protein